MIFLTTVKSVQNNMLNYFFLANIDVYVKICIFLILMSNSKY